jgi:transcriptional regulator with XRE-family HTH domain
LSGVSQVELAKRMGCAQSKVSKMETSTDQDLNFGDVISYASAMRQSVQIRFSPATKNSADDIKYHVECIKHELDRLVQSAGDNKEARNGVEAFAIQTAQRLIANIESTLDALPHRIERRSVPVTVAAEGERGERLRSDAPGHSLRRKKKSRPAGC